MKVSIQLPFFPGFYETAYENSDTAYWAIKNELEYYQRDLVDEHPEYQHLTEDDLDFDYRGYRKAVMESFIDSFSNHTPDFVESVEFDELDSPKYYNFRNDHLYAFVELADDWKEKMRAFMDSDKEWLRKRVKEEWTSYDGFDSYMSNNFDDTSHDDDEDYWGRKSWYFHLFSGKSDRWECYLSTIIGYMMYRENENIFDDLLMETFEGDDTYDCMYVFITEEAQERLNKMIENGEVKIPDPDQMELPFED